MRRLFAASLALSSALLFAAACGDDAAGGAECHCDFGDVCTEYGDECDTLACESNGEDVKADGACDASGAIARCECNDEGDTYTDYYFEGDVESLREQCEFFCQSPTFEEL